VLLVRTFDADVAVVGLGALGASTLWRLAVRGVDVVGFERYEPGHPLGSTHGHTRLFRTACMEHPALVPLAQESLRLWRELEATSSRRLLDLCGGLMIGAPDSSVVAGTRAAAAAHALDVEVLTSRELAGSFPQHADVPADHVAIWDPAAGVGRPEDAVLAAVGAAEAAGATIYAGTAVSAVELRDGGVLVRTPARDFHARHVIVTAGPWLAELVPELPLQALRTPMTWFAAREGAGAFDLDAFPVFIRCLPDGSRFWGHGAVHGQPVKVGSSDDPSVHQPTDPSRCERGISAEDYRVVSRLVATALPGLDPVPVRTTTCMITRSPDGQFMLGSPRGDGRLVVGGGCSGHAFKHATGIGETLARIACAEEPFLDLDFVDPDRFATARPA
jgi:sarcosine oxidase